MNYKRKKNLPEIISSLKSQSVSCRIFLWNNANTPYEDDRLDLIINSSQNLKCWPRWGLSAYTDTPYIMSHDDDFQLGSSDCLEILINELENNYIPGRAVGFSGVRLGSDLSFFPTDFQKKLRKIKIHKGAKHISNPGQDKIVDVIKGRLIFCKRYDLSNLPTFADEAEDMDDIFVSSYLSKGKLGHHLVTSALNEKIIELPGGDGEMALSQMENWEDLRSRVARRCFSVE
ncbi:MAG: hypothetical protein NXI20_08880 [bacterium]|nr:hypothetical protein [bacterium]